jgi:hypothetical protein
MAVRLRTARGCAVVVIARPNVRGNRAPTAGRQRPGDENVPRTTARALAPRRWCSG